MATFAPSAASFSAAARPSPSLPPVMMVTLPLRPSSSMKRSSSVGIRDVLLRLDQEVNPTVPRGARGRLLCAHGTIGSVAHGLDAGLADAGFHEIVLGSYGPLLGDDLVGLGRPLVIGVSLDQYQSIRVLGQPSSIGLHDGQPMPADVRVSRV